MKVLLQCAIVHKGLIQGVRKSAAATGSSKQRSHMVYSYATVIVYRMQHGA